MCQHASCQRAFGYKHLLQRHVAKVHANPSGTSDEAESSEGEDPAEPQKQDVRLELDIDDITGKTYAVRSQKLLAQSNRLRCPHPDLHGLVDDATARVRRPCEYVFSRAYDLKRHLLSEHGLEVDRERVDNWVKTAKKAKAAYS